jgi:hypothetical protein
MTNTSTLFDKLMNVLNPTENDNMVAASSSVTENTVNDENLGTNYERLFNSSTKYSVIALKDASIYKKDDNFIKNNLVPGVPEILVEKMKSLYDFAHFESPSGKRRNLLNWTLFCDEGVSNPTYLIFRLQFELNNALKKIGKESIDVDGFFGLKTAKALQEVISYQLPDQLKSELEIDGKLVSKQATSLAFVFALPTLIAENNTLVGVIINVMEIYGSIMQQDAFPIAKYPDGKPFIGV